MQKLVLQVTCKCVARRGLRAAYNDNLGEGLRAADNTNIGEALLAADIANLGEAYGLPDPCSIETHFVA